MNNTEMLRQGLKDFGIEPSDKMLNDFKVYRERY